MSSHAERQPWHDETRPETTMTCRASNDSRRVIDVVLRQGLVYTLESFFSNDRVFILSPRVLFSTPMTLNLLKGLSGNFDLGHWKNTRSQLLCRTDKNFLNELYGHMFVPVLYILPPWLLVQLSYMYISFSDVWSSCYEVQTHSCVINRLF